MATNKPKPPLMDERTYFEEKYEELSRKHIGEVVLIHGRKILGLFKTMQDAEEAAYRRFNLFGQPFLMRPIVSQEEEREEVFQRISLANLE